MGEGLRLNRAPRGRRLLDDERGAMLVVAALVVSLMMFAVGAIVVDLGIWFQKQRLAQTSADAGALAAAAQLPSVPNATARGTEYVGRNIAGASSSVVTPYKGDPTKVEVTVSLTAKTFFGRALGLGQITISRRAVAEQFVQQGNLAIYARDSNCNESLAFNGEDIVIDGRAHSNGLFDVDGKTFFTAEGTYANVANDPKCDPTTNGKIEPGSSFGGAPYPTLTAYEDWPFWTTRGAFICPATPLKHEFNTNGVTLDGIYCARESIILNGQNITGTVTFIAPEIKINGANADLKPKSQGVLFFVPPNMTPESTDDGPGPPDPCKGSSKELQIDAADVKLEGIIFHPCDKVLVNDKDNISVKGMIVAETVKINARGFMMEGTGGPSGLVQLALTE